MDKVQQLFVRACKSGKGLKRVESVYRRFYSKGLSYQEQRRAIISLLLDICAKYCPIDTKELVNKLNPNSIYVHFVYNGYYDYEQVLRDILFGHIATSPKSLFEGL